MTAKINDFYNKTTKTFTVTLTYTGITDFTGDKVRLVMKYSSDSPTINTVANLTSGGVGSFVLTTTDTNIYAKPYLVYMQWERQDGTIYPIPLDSDIVTVKENPVP